MINAAFNGSLDLGSGFVTREPISIFSRIKNASDEEEKKKLNQLLETLRKKLPKGFKIGAAVDKGDCFFDSVAQGLKDEVLITDSEKSNVKSLRQLCANHAEEYKDEIINNAKVGGYFVAQENYVYPRLVPIQDEKGDNVPDKGKTFDKYLENIKKTVEEINYPIWGRLDIEGKIICEKYKVQIEVIELRDEQVGGVYVTTGEQGEGSNVIHIVNYRNHFVPLLSNLKEDIEEGKEVSRKKVYGENHTEKNGVEDQDNPEVQQAIMNSLSSFSQGAENSNSEGEGNLIQPFKTKGDGSCFFHVVFGDVNSSGMYQTNKAQAMRQEWRKFLGKFESLEDKLMPEKLKKTLSLIFMEVFSKKKSEELNSDHIYKEYLAKIAEQSYFIYVDEICILASLANIEIKLHIQGQRSHDIKPDKKLLSEDYERNDKVWGKRKQVEIYHDGGGHFSYVGTSVEQSPLKDIGNSPRKRVGTSHSKSPDKENTPPDNHQSYKVKKKVTRLKKDGRVEKRSNWYTAEEIEENPDLLFLFGDNDKAKYRIGKENPGGEGQAKATRPTENGALPFDRMKKDGGKNGNAIGITTTFHGGYTPSLNEFKVLMDKEFAPVETWVKGGGSVVIPCNAQDKHSLGTGIANLEKCIPGAIEYIQSKVDNLVGLGKQNVAQGKDLSILKEELHSTLSNERKSYESHEKLQGYLHVLLTENGRRKALSKGDVSRKKFDLDECSEDFIKGTLVNRNFKIQMENFVILNIIEHVYKWDENSNIIFGVEGCANLLKKLNKFKGDKDKVLIYIINKNGNHWVTLVAVHVGNKDVIFYADSYGEEINKCSVSNLSRGKCESPDGNKENGSNTIRRPLDEFLEKEGFSKESISDLSLPQQKDSCNCGVFALENAKAILNAVKDGNYDPAKVKESLKAVNKDVESLNTLRKYFANSLKKVSPINKQSSVAFSSSSEESIEQRPLQNAENIPRENDRSITSQKRPGKKDDGKLHQKCVVLCEKLEEQVSRGLKKISRKYILIDEKRENELSDFTNFINEQKKGGKEFGKFWEGFISLSDEEKKKAILRIFFFAEFWDSSKDENEGAFRNIVWNKLCELNAQDYIFRESVDYFVSFASSPLVCIYKDGNGLQRVLSRAKSFLLEGEMGNLIIKICIKIFNMHNTFNRGEFIKSDRVVECLSTLEKFCEAGRKDKIADFKLGNDQDCEKIYRLLGKRPGIDIRSAIRSLIEKIESKETEEEENALEGFISDLDKEDLTQIYQCDQIKGFLKQHDYYLITFAIDEVIQHNESSLELVLSIAKDHFSEEEMNAMLKRACQYIVDHCNKPVEGVAFNSKKAFYSLSGKVGYKNHKILELLASELIKVPNFSNNYQLSMLQQTRKEVVSHSPSCRKNVGNRNRDCSKNFFDELTTILDGGETDKGYEIESFISSRFSGYKGNCLYRLLLGAFLFKNQDHAQISQKYLLLHLDNQSIAFLLTVGQREKAKTTVLSIIDKSRNLVPNIGSFVIDHRNLQIVNLGIDSCESHLLDDIKKEDIERGYKIKFISINEKVISLNLLKEVIKDVKSKKQVIDNLNNIVSEVNFAFNLDDDKRKFSFIRNEKDCETLVNGLLMGSEHKISFDSEIINEIISSLVKNNIQAKSNNIRDRHLPIAGKRSGKKGNQVEYYNHLSRKYSIFSSQSNVQGDRATFNRSSIREKRERPIINEKDYGCNDLHLAIADNKIDDVKKLIGSNGEYVKGQDRYGNTPLHFAVQKNNLEIFKALMNYIAVNDKEKNCVVAKNDDRCTPLHFAAKSGNVEVVKKLLEFIGAEAREDYVRSKNNKGETPLHFAARSGKAEVVSKLLEFVDAKAKEGYVQSKDSNGKTPLHFAAESGNVKVVEKLLKCVNDKEGYVKHENNNKCTPLYFAAGSGNVEVVKKLLRYVNNKERYVQSTNSQGDTPLHFAAKKRDNVGVILSLIECVTEKENYVKRTNKLLCTPLHFAAKFGDVEVINKLLEFVGTEAKEDYVKSKNNKGETPLHFAARSGNVKAVEKLIDCIIIRNKEEKKEKKEKYVRAETSKKETPLHFAAGSGNVEVVKKLLRYVNNKERYVQSTNSQGETPLHFAARSGNVKAVEKLLEYVNDNDKEGYVRAENSEKETSLHFAVRVVNVAVVKKLLECVAKGEEENYIKCENNDGKNALEIAISYGNQEVFLELLKYIKNSEREQYYKELIAKKTHSNSGTVRDGNNPCSQSEGPTSSYSKKRPRTSGGNTQKPPVKKVAQQEVKIKSNVGSDKSYEQQDSNRERGPEISSSRSSSSGSQEGEQPTLNDVESNGENQEAFSRSSSTSDENDNNNLSEESGSRSSVDVRDNNDLQDVSLQDDVYEEEDENSSSQSNSSPESLDELQNDTINRSLDDMGGTILHLFVRINHHCRAIDNLIDSGADVNATDKRGYTPLHFAAIKGYYEIVLSLMCKGADVNVKDFDGRTPLEIAETKGHTKCIGYLQSNGLHNVYDESLSVNSYRELQEFVNLEYDKKYTSLHLAVKSNNVQDVKSLIAIGADVSIKATRYEYAPLHFAVGGGNEEIVKILIEAGADPNAEVKESKWTALHYAARYGKAEVVDILIKANANLGAKTILGYTPLCFAVKGGNKEIVKILIEAGAGRKAVAEINKTPFSFLVNALDIGTPSPGTTLNNVALDNQLRKRSLSF